MIVESPASVLPGRLLYVATKNVPSAVYCQFFRLRGWNRSYCPRKDSQNYIFNKMEQNRMAEKQYK